MEENKVLDQKTGSGDVVNDTPSKEKKAGKKAESKKPEAKKAEAKKTDSNKSEVKKTEDKRAEVNKAEDKEPLNNNNSNLESETGKNDAAKKASEPVVKKTESTDNPVISEEDDIEITSVDKMGSAAKKAAKNPEKLDVDKRKMNRAEKTRNKRFFKKLKKWLIILSVIFIIGFVGLRYASYKAGQLLETLSGGTTYAQVERMDLASTISTTGTIQSKDVRTLNSALNGVTIEAVNYKVGDMVKEGEVVVTFSKDDISKKIADLEVDIVQAQAELALTTEYKAREHEYDYGTAAYNNYTAEFKTEDAQISVAQAERDLNEACADKSEFVEKYNEAVANIDGLKREIEELSAQYDLWKLYGNMPTRETDAMHAYWYYTTDDGFQNRISELKTQQNNYQNTIDSYDSKIASYTKSIENAQDKLLSAQRSATSTVASQYETYRNTSNNIVTSDYNYARDSLTANDNLTKLIRNMEEYEASLDDYIVFAPISGMVTAVNAQEGNGYTSATGALMTIQAIDVLEVTTQIDEYDINNVQVGQRVVIMTDATGNDELEGTVTFIAPTASGSGSSNTATSSSTSTTYEVKIDILNKDNRLKLGMSAKLNIILDSHSDVLAVRYDAIEEGANGEKYVYVVDAPRDGGSKNFQKRDPEAESTNPSGIPVVGQFSDDDNKSKGGEKPDFGENNKKQGFLSYLFDFNSDKKASDVQSSGLSSAAKKVTVEIGIEGDYYTEIKSREILEGMTVTVNNNNENSLNMFGMGFGGDMGGEMVVNPDGPEW